MRRAVFGWGPAAVWAGVLFLLSAWEDPVGPRVLKLLPDELLHLGVYTVFGAALWWAREHRHPRTSPWFFWLLGWAFAASDEWHQSFVPGRTPALGDWLADALGVLLGFGAAFWIGRTIRESRKDRQDNDIAPKGSEPIDRTT